MKKYEKEVLQHQLTAEEQELKRLKAIYNKAMQDIDDSLAQLLGRDDATLQHVIYQIDYQKALKKQVGGILDELNSKQFTSISEYLAECYENGFVSSMYCIHKQGVPILAPINQNQVITAVKHESKISEGLYKKLGVDTDNLKQRISNNISRGIASGHGYAQIARNIAEDGKVGYNNAARIAQTDGARIHNAAAFDAQKEAKKKGADILKQWNSTLDGGTRPLHRQLDGQLRELDEPFEIGGYKAMHPLDFGIASEDINCRCSLLQRARWALDDDELETLKERAAYYGLDKTKDFDDFKQKYLKAAEEVSVPKPEKAFTPAKTVEEAKKQIEDIFENTDFERLGEVDSELFINNANQLNKLENKFGIIKKQGAKFSVNGKQFNVYGAENAIAAVDEKEFVNGVLKKAEMSINPAMYSDKNKFISNERRSIERGFTMPCSEEYKSVSAITHEYGHMLQSSITYKKFDDLVDEYQKIAKEKELLITKLKTEIDPAESLKLYEKSMELNDSLEELQRKIAGFKKKEEAVLAQGINDEITHIAKDLMRERDDYFAGLSDDEIDIQMHLSNYGKSTPFEFFAEVFANSQCGEPNLLGEAMNIWLEKGGYIK